MCGMFRSGLAAKNPREAEIKRLSIHSHNIMKGSFKIRIASFNGSLDTESVREALVLVVVCVCGDGGGCMVGGVAIEKKKKTSLIAFSPF
mmetsp:Transcript_31021/g.77595  ORF Transcript_31021/g.77595 Transcript_31021/m.77595 type:complete len:90 (-) Transcript_31021:2-271(-)